MKISKLSKKLDIPLLNIQQYLSVHHDYSNVIDDIKLDYTTVFQVKMYFKSKDSCVINHHGIKVTAPTVFYIIKNSVVSTIEIVRVSPRQVLFIQDGKGKFDSCYRFVKTIYSHILPERFHKLI